MLDCAISKLDKKIKTYTRTAAGMTRYTVRKNLFDTRDRFVGHVARSGFLSTVYANVDSENEPKAELLCWSSMQVAVE